MPNHFHLMVYVNRISLAGSDATAADTVKNFGSDASAADTVKNTVKNAFDVTPANQSVSSAESVTPHFCKCYKSALFEGTYIKLFYWNYA